jgi:hypothetical protein
MERNKRVDKIQEKYYKWINSRFFERLWIRKRREMKEYLDEFVVLWKL